MLIGLFKEYKGYVGSIEIDIENAIHCGRILKIDDFVNYEAENIIDLEKQFHKAVDDYIEFKKDVGKE